MEINAQIMLQCMENAQFISFWAERILKKHILRANCGLRPLFITMWGRWETRERKKIVRKKEMTIEILEVDQKG